MARTILDMFDLHGRVALVSGGAQGMGRAMALAFAEAGADLVLPSHSNVAGVEDTAEQARKLGRRAVVVPGDMTDVGQIRSVFKALDREFGRIDILGAVAGPGFRASAEDIELDKFQQVIYGLTTARFCCCQEAGRRMLKQGRGSIINIGSLASVTALGRGNFAYSVGMGAVAMLTRELSTEWCSRGVRVNAILPGQVTNPGLQAYWAADPAVKETMLRGIPMGRFGAPDDIKGVALLLASDASAWMTGALIPFDGGNLAMNAGGSAGPYKAP
ncbi:MAG: SDR family oxidoreductase [Spirochaetia bacterium]|jgi:NAD(P)-dependent dehydrogenase (short-subunit alcohol dehydrogenase family)